MDSKEEYHDPDYPEAPVCIKEEPPSVSEEEKVEKIKRIIRREFMNEIEERQSEVTLIDQRMTTARRLLYRLRYDLVSSYYNELKLKLSSAKVEDEVAAIKDPKSKAEISSLLRDGQRNIHPSVKKLLGKKEVDISEIFKSRAPRNRSKKDYSAMLQKRNYTISADATKTLRPNLDIKAEPSPETSRPRKVPRALKPSANVLTLDEGTRNQMKHRYRIVIGNTSKYTPAASRSDRSTHKWLLYVRGTALHPDISRIVTAVTVKLHHSYAPHHVVHLSKPPYHITRRGWGEFPAKIELEFSQPQLNRPALVQHTIKLDTDCTGLQTLGGETLVDVWLYSTQEMLEYEYKDDTQTDEQTDTTELIQPKTEPIEDSDSQTDNWLEFFSNEQKEISFDVDEMIIKPKKEPDDYYEPLVVNQPEPEKPSEIPKKPNSPKKRIVKYIEPTTGKIYYLEMDRALDLTKVQEIVINNTTAKISPIKSNGLKSVRKKKKVSLLKNSVKNDFSHIQNDHCYLATPCSDNIKKEHSVYNYLCSVVYKFDCVRTAVNFLVKKIPLVSEEARDPDYLKYFPFVVENYERFWKMEFAKRRNIEWSRAKLINRILTENFTNNDTIWRTKQILIYSRLHGHYPIRKDCMNDKTETSDDIDRPSNVTTLSIFDPSPYSCQSDVLNLTGSDDEVDVVSCQSPVKVKVEMPREEVLTVLPIENDDDRLRCLFVEKKCSDIGIELRCEDVGNGYSYSAVHSVLMSAVRSLAEELLREGLSSKLSRTPTAWPGSSHSRELVSCCDVIQGASGGRLSFLTDSSLATTPKEKHNL